MSIIAYTINIGKLINQLYDIQTWANLRKENSFQDVLGKNLFFTIFGNNTSIVIPIAFALRKNSYINTWIFSFVLLYSLFISIILFTRAPVLNFFIVSFLSYIYIYQKSINRKVLLYLLLLISFFLFLFLVSQNILYSNISSPFEDLKIYFLSGINNIQLIVDGEYLTLKNLDSKYYSVDFLNYILNRLGIINSYPSLIRNYSSYIESNVYSYLDAYILDFGLLGFLIGPTFIALLGKFIYFQMIRYNNLLYIIIYIAFSYYTIMIFINNEFIRFSFLLLYIKALVIYKLINLKT